MIEIQQVVRPLRAAESVRHVADADADFELRADGEGAAEGLLARPGVSLYALDPIRGGVTFVETASDADVLGAPFLHQAQRNHARRVFRVPYAALHAFAASHGARDVSPILVHSVGRCGSTLISDMLGAATGVASLSEPDVYTGVERAVADGTLTSDEAVAVLRSALSLATHGLAPNDARPAIKFRSEVAWIARQLNAAAPDACTLFLYRDARRVIESYLRVLGRRQNWKDRLAHVPVLDDVMAARHRRKVERRGARMERFAYVLTDGTPTEVEARGRWGKFLLQWLAKVHAYVDLHNLREDVAAVRYEELVADPEGLLRAVFAHCGLPEEDVTAAAAAMGRDSQRGTAFRQGAREEWHLSARDEREMAETFRDCTPYPGPDMILPGTLSAL